MGDRVIFQVVHTEFSPAMYGHWCGSRADKICRNLKSRMDSRGPDVSYTAARVMQEMMGDDEGNLSFGMWNMDQVLTKDFSHGDAGIVLIKWDNKHQMYFECFGGYWKIVDGEFVNKYETGDCDDE